MYSYNRGVFDTQLPSMLKQCPPTKDPVTCGLDGYGGHTANIRDACRLLDSVPESELYDFEVTKDDVEYFIKVRSITISNTPTHRSSNTDTGRNVPV